MDRRFFVLLVLCAIGLTSALVSGCQPAPAPTEATDPPVTEWSDVSTPFVPTLPPTEAGMVNFEPTAAAVGSVPYSGYACSFKPDGCECAEAAVIKAGFTFEPGEKMLYEFRGDTYAATWEMSRLSPNQWSYTIPIGADQSDGTPSEAGHFFFVLTFTSDGFTLLQSQDRGDGTQITCPEVAYTRLSAVTPGP